MTLRLALVMLSGQTYFCLDITLFRPDNYKYLLGHISIILNFWSIRSVKDVGQLGQCSPIRTSLI